MASKRMYQPPILKSGEDFENWEREIKIWQCVTDLEKKKQAPAIYLSLEGQARQCCADIKVETLHSDSGVDELIKKLKTLYDKGAEQAAFIAYEEFETFQRPPSMSILDYINEFERSNNKIKSKKIELPDAVLAYRLLKSANVSEQKQTLARATISKLTFEDMKKQLKAIFDQQAGSSNQQEYQDVPVKVEPTYHSQDVQNDNEEKRVLYSKSQPHNSRGFRGWRGGSTTRYNQRGSARYASSGARPKEDERRQRSGNVSVRKSNPPDRSGNISRCVVCDSVMHWVKDCPHKDEVHVQLFTKDIKDEYINQFVGETLNAAVLDSGCTRTVCGKLWLDCYIDSLSKEDSKLIEERPTSTRFKFGDGRVVQASRKVIIPEYIGDMKVNIETDVVSDDLPLLLSKQSMKTARTTIDFANDKVTMLDQVLNLHFTSSGHYTIGITKEQQEDTSEGIRILLCKEEKDKRKVALKLHQQFAHAPSKRIISLIKDANVEDQELFKSIIDVEDNCQICKRYKRPQLKPAVGFSLAREFNETVSMDLKTYHGFLFLPIIDHATRFSTAAVIRSKKTKKSLTKFSSTGLHFLAVQEKSSVIMGGGGGGSLTTSCFVIWHSC